MAGFTYAAPAITVDELGKPVISLEDAAVYRFGHLLRSTEELLLRLFSEGLLSGTTHTCIGQELCQMSVVRALNGPHDHLLSNHRNHGHFLTYSGAFLGLVAEIMGREAGVCGGIGGSQHLAFRHFHSNGVQAGMTAIGVGQALARRRDGQDGVTAIVIGDGTLGEGLLYESMNLASIWRLPVLFVLEHNRIAQTTPTKDTIGGDMLARGAAFGLRTLRLQDDDPGFLRQVDEFVAQVRDGRPSMLMIDTERLGPHSKGDDLRTAEEMAYIRQRDPLAATGRRLPDAERDAIEAENRSVITEIYREALASPPASHLEAARTILHPACEHPRAAHAAVEGNVRLQLNSALSELLRDEPRVILLGEDLHDPYGGAFKVTAGLSSAYPDRVISTPISEAGVVGAGIGLAMSGYRPVVEIMFADFVTLSMDQLFNHAVKFPGMYPDTSVPLVVRAANGGGRGYGPTHSQCPENLLAAVPGLTVVAPSHRHPVGAMLKSAVLSWPNPTVFFEHKLLYGEPAAAGPFARLDSHPQDHGLELFPTMIRRTDSPDVTLIAYGGMLPAVEQLAQDLASEELSVEIVAPSLLNPVPRHQLCDHLRDRDAVVVVEEGYAETGFGCALGAALLERGFRGRFARVSPPPVPIPAARSLETGILPGRSRILDAVLQTLGL
ncbi:MAG TPA: thiamine pyrophosphate-dependent enzyme [Vicinamibacterales bacterium]|nr:thiamine pyrophosphate-dependent enzyme [Vicinamibacterales bacterium]